MKMTIGEVIMLRGYLGVLHEFYLKVRDGKDVSADTARVESALRNFDSHLSRLEGTEITIKG